jgi:hypothetical protein
LLSPISWSDSRPSCGAARRGADDLLAIRAAAVCATAVLEHDTPIADYRHGLQWLDVGAAQIAEAVAAICNDKHSEDSLPGRLTKIVVNDTAYAKQCWLTDGDSYRGRAEAAKEVLVWIGISVP